MRFWRGGPLQSVSKEKFDVTRDQYRAAMSVYSKKLSMFRQLKETEIASDKSNNLIMIQEEAVKKTELKYGAVSGASEAEISAMLSDPNAVVKKEDFLNVLINNKTVGIPLEQKVENENGQFMEPEEIYQELKKTRENRDKLKRIFQSFRMV